MYTVIFAETTVLAVLYPCLRDVCPASLLAAVLVSLLVFLGLGSLVPRPLPPRKKGRVGGVWVRG